jgi:phage I-like protein
MINKTISSIEARIRQTGTIREDEKIELIKLLSELRAEVTELSETHREQAESIARFTDVSTHEATREEKDSRLLNLSVDGLTSSVEGFENSHPRLVQIVNRISVMLAGIGI